MKTRERATLRYVAFIVFVDMAGVGLVTPGMPQLIRDLAQVDIGRAAQIGGYMFVAFAAMQFLFSPIIGSLSDRFGRRPILLVTLASFAIDYGVMAATSSLTLLVIGRMISGVTGATWAAANSCIADVVPPSERSAAFGAVGGAGAAGLVFGPAIGGLAGEYGLRLPFVLAALFAAVGVVIGFYSFAETLPETARRPFSLSRANPIGSLIAMRTSRFIRHAIIVLFLIQFALQAQIAVWPYYGAASFGWTPLTTGLTTALYGILMVIVRALLTRRAVSRFGAGTTARIGTVFAIPSYIILGLARNTETVVLAILIGSLAGMTYPALQTLMTAKTRLDEQGELQGIMASSNAITAILGPALMTSLFERCVDPHGVYLPGAPFLFGAVLLMIATALTWQLTAFDDVKARSE
ncbi:MAG: MFS transporter [Sphingomonas phyllosphaerae]